MATEAKLRITAEDKTKKAFKSIDRSLKGMSSSVSGVLSRLGPLVGVSAVAGFGALTSRALKSVDALAKTADQLEITTESLASLQHLTDIYTRASAPAMSEALIKATKRLGEFNATGGGAAATWLKTLNLDTKALAELKPDELFKTYAEAIGGLNDRGQQLAAISALMGDESRALIGIIDAGAGVFDEAADRVEKFGTGVSRLDASKIEDANDAITTMQEVIKGLGVEIAVELAPRITQFLNWMLDIEESIASLSEVQVLNRLTDVSDQLEKIEGQLSRGRFRGPSGKRRNELTEQRLDLLLKEAELQERLNGLQNSGSDRPVRVDPPGRVGSSDDSKAKNLAERRAQKQAQLLEREEEQDRSRLTAKFFRLDESLLSEQERLRLAFEEKEFVIEEAFQIGLSSDAERKQRLLDIEQQHQLELRNINQRGLTDREKFEKKSGREKLKTQLSLLTQMTQGVASSSKSAFKLNKALALANAAVSLPDAVIQTFRNNGGYPWGIAPAALMAATGAAQIAAISSSSFGGGAKGAPSVGGGGSAPSLAGTGIDSIVGTRPLNDVNQNSLQPITTVSVNIGDDGRLLPTVVVRQLIEEIGEALQDMGSNSRLLIN